MKRDAQLRRIAQQVLNEEGCVDVDILLNESRLRNAEAYILGGLDHRVEAGTIDHETAKGLYRELGVDPERASKLRAHHSSGGSA